METALYHPDCGYYARSVRRSGRAGDFFTSVDVGPLFGRLLACQIAEMAETIAGLEARGSGLGADRSWDLIEAGAGNGRLTADILSALQQDAPAARASVGVHLVEASPTARAAQRDTLGAAADRLVSSTGSLPERLQGVLIANELLDALPVHQVVMRETGLCEVYVDLVDGSLVAREGPPSTSRLAAHLRDLGISLEPGWRAEISLAAVDWVRTAARRIERGFMILIDYGHEARELYSVTHSAGTLTTYSHHAAGGPERTRPAWLGTPGHVDLTAHVDFTSVRRAAEAEGWTSLGFLDQMYFLMALAGDRMSDFDLKERLAFKTLIMPGGLGTTMKVLMLGKGVGTPSLVGLSAGTRVT